MIETLLGQLFVMPLEVPTRALALLWALPISLTVAIVYKALKLPTLETGFYIREVLLLFIWILACLILAALVLLAIAHLAWR